MPEELRDYVRREPPLPGKTVVVRGGIDTVEKLARHATRMSRAFVLDGRVVWGVSAFAMPTDDPLQHGPLGHDLSSYRRVHMTTAGVLTSAGFELLPTFARPHVTVVIRSLNEIDALLEALGDPSVNPYYDVDRRRRRRRG